MPDRVDYVTLFIYFLGAATSAGGACAVASVLYIRGAALKAHIMLAYTVVGFFFGLVYLVVAVSVLGLNPTVENVVMHGGGGGAAISLLLSGTNITIRFASRKLMGKELVLEMKDVEDKGNGR